MRRIVRGALVLFALYWATLFVLTHVPISVQSPARHFDKFVHFFAYAGLGAGMIVVLPSAWRRSVFGLLFAIGAACLYGVVDEIIQGFVPGRTADLLDWCADAAGAAVGASIAWTAAGLSRLWSRNSRPLLHGERRVSALRVPDRT
ncbi:MAG TPA: VanZ family protein [Pirellulaceae bacterium]|jgi:VanZ family protein|nr:VanZ family protein [Pirellulaceae bacterium]